MRRKIGCHLSVILWITFIFFLEKNVNERRKVTRLFSHCGKLCPDSSAINGKSMLLWAEKQWISFGKQKYGMFSQPKPVHANKFKVMRVPLDWPTVICRTKILSPNIYNGLNKHVLYCRIDSRREAVWRAITHTYQESLDNGWYWLQLNHIAGDQLERHEKLSAEAGYYAAAKSENTMNYAEIPYYKRQIKTATSGYELRKITGIINHGEKT